MNIFQKLFSKFGKKEKTGELGKPLAEAKSIDSTKLKQRIDELERGLLSAEEKKTALQEELNKTKAELAKLDAEVKEQKQRIEELEEDLEDADDETKKTRKKLDETKKEKSALQEELDQKKNENEQIKKENEIVKSDLESTTKDLGLKKKSIDFVNEILNAKAASDRRVLETEEKIYAITNFVWDSICDVFKELYKEGQEIADRIGSEIWKWANLQRKTWLKDKKVVAFIGEFSAGKTSIVNRIFTQDRKDAAFTLPVGRKATTAVATYISYGSNSKVTFTNPAGELCELSKGVFEEFTKESLENISVSRLVSHFVTEYNNDNLRSLSILDTPGFSSGDKEDTKRTTDVINEADMLFWVVDANTGEINTRSLEIIKEHIKHIPLYVVINKVDTKAPAERNQIEAKMRLTMEKNQIPVQGFIQFSTKEPLEVLSRVISGVQPVRPDYDVITDIKSRFDDCIKWCNEQIEEFKKEAETYNRAINEAESVMDSYSDKFDRLTNRYNYLINSLNSDENKTFFGNVKWEKLVPILDSQIDVVNQIIKLDDEYSNAVGDYVSNSHKKSELESLIAERKDKQKRLENLRDEFNKKLKELN